jgi:rhodanese-related sulfurtransferase
MMKQADLPLEIDVHAVKAMLDLGEEFLLLDCREVDEYELVRIGAAKLIPMSELMLRVNELEPWLEKRLVVHCHHGGRSLQVTQWLRRRGFTQTQNMTGGIEAWSCHIDPSLPRY